MKTNMPRSLDRREFISMSSAAAAVALLPLPSLVVAGPVANAVTGPLLNDWTIDDMFGVYPRYAQAIGFGRPAPEHVATTDTLDRLFYA